MTASQVTAVGFVVVTWVAPAVAAARVQPSPTVTIVQNGRIVADPAYPYDGHGYDFDASPGDNDLPWLRSFADQYGIFEDVNMNLDWKDREFEMMLAIVRFTTHMMRWTGTNTVPTSWRAKVVLQTMVDNPGAEWSCSRIAAAAIGLAQAHGIPARMVAGIQESSLSGDNICEFYSTRFNRWVVFFSHTTAWFEHEVDGPLGTYAVRPLDNAELNRRDGAISPLVHMPDESRRYAPREPYADTQWWERYFDHAGVTYITRMQTASNYQCRFAAADDWASQTLGYDWDAFDDLDDIDAPLNNVVASVEMAGNEAVVTLEHNMFEFVRYEVSEDGGPWLPADVVPDQGGQFTWDPQPGEELRIRGVGLGDVHSPDVVLRACIARGDRDFIDRPAVSDRHPLGRFREELPQPWTVPAPVDYVVTDLGVGKAPHQCVWPLTRQPVSSACKWADFLASSPVCSYHF